METRTSTVCTVACAAVLVGYIASAAAFRGEPTVARTRTGHTITFALTRATDVTVRILDSTSKVVRHLASGMVGLERAANPFKANSLSQSIFWDGADDAGKKVPGECTVLVGAGLTARFDKFLLYEPNGIGGGAPRRGKLRCTVTKGLGDEYLVAQENGVHLSTLRVFDKDGKYLRCVWPYSLDKPRNVIEPFLRDTDWGANDWDGDRIPLSSSICALVRGNEEQGDRRHNGRMHRGSGRLRHRRALT